LYSLSQAFAFAANAFVDALRVPVVAGMHENCGGEPTPRREIMLKNVLVRRAVRYALLANTIALTCATVQAAEEPITEVVVHRLAHCAPRHRSLDAGAGAQRPGHRHGGLAEHRRHHRGASGGRHARPVAHQSNFLTSSNGVSTLNLRNMEDQRTLVLINGRRVVSGVDGTSTVDVNNIPTDLIESVQVLTGGASAVYGSEAVAGVVNFILKDDYEGLNFRGQTGGSTEGDAERHMFSLTGGLNIGDRGNVTANVQYDRDFGLRSRDRAISANDIPARSSLPPQGRFPLDGTNWTFGPDNVLKGHFRHAGRRLQPQRRALSSQRRSKRTLVTVLGNYHLTDSVRLFAEGGYSKMKSNSSLEPLATTNADAQLPDGTILPGLSRDNPFIPAPILAQDGRSRRRNRRGRVPADEQAHERRVRSLEQERSQISIAQSSAWTATSAATGTGRRTTTAARRRKRPNPRRHCATATTSRSMQSRIRRRVSLSAVTRPRALRAARRSIRSASILFRRTRPTTSLRAASRTLSTPK
jgi:outer membrane receptor protein involved in Fe transport